MGWYLVRKPVAGVSVNERIDISDKGVLLGRGRDCAVLCLSMFVSRHHCTVKPLDCGRIGLVDLGSSNGTFINTRRVLPQEEEILAAGDEIGIGNIDANDENSFIYIVNNDKLQATKEETKEDLKKTPPNCSKSGKREPVNGCARKRFVLEDEDIDKQLVTISDSEEEVPLAPAKKPKLYPKGHPADDTKEIPSLLTVNDVKATRVQSSLVKVEDAKPKKEQQPGNEVKRSTDCRVQTSDRPAARQKVEVDEEAKPSTSGLVPHDEVAKRVEKSGTPAYAQAADQTEVREPAVNMRRAENRRLSELRGDRNGSRDSWSNNVSRSASTPARSNQRKSLSLTTSTPCQPEASGCPAPTDSSEEWSPISKRLSVDEQLEQVRARQVAEDRALAERLAAEELQHRTDQTTVRLERSATSTSSVNYSVDEECVIISGDEDEDFPASQMFLPEEPDVKPNTFEVDQMLIEMSLKDSPPPPKSPERVEDEDIILIDDDEEEDEEGVKEASIWFERLSQSQSSVKVKEEPPDKEEPPVEDEGAHSECSDTGVSSQEQFQRDRGAKVALANEKIKEDALHEKANERRLSEDRRSLTSCSSRSGAKRSSESDVVDLDQDSEDGGVLSIQRIRPATIDPAGRRDSEDSLTSRPVSSKHYPSTSQSKDEAKERRRHRRESGKEHRDQKKDDRTQRERDRSKKSDKRSHRSGDRGGDRHKEKSATDRKKKHDDDDKRRRPVKPFLDDSDDSAFEEPRSITPIDENRIPQVKLTRVEEDRSLPPQFQLRKKMPDPDSTTTSEEEIDENDEADAACSSHDTRKPGASGSRRIALTEALPMPPRRAHRRGISGPEATRMYEERQQSGKQAPAVDKKDLRKQRLAEVAQRKNKEMEKREEAKRGAPAKVKVTAANRGSFLTQAEEQPSSSRPRSRRDVVLQMGRIPKRDKCAAPQLPAKSPLQQMNLSWEKDPAPKIQLTDEPFMPPLEIPTGPQPKRRIAQQPPPGFRDDAVPRSESNTPKPSRRPKSAPPRSPVVPLCQEMSKKTSTGPVKSILSGSSKHNIAVNKKTVKFRENLVEIFEIERIPGTRPVNDLPQRVRDSMVLPKPSFVPQDETALQDVIYDLSKWNPMWLREEKQVSSDAVPPVVSNMNLPTVPLTEFLDFKEYYDTMYPLLMLELWSGVSKEYNMRESNYRNGTMNNGNEMFMAVDQAIPLPIKSRPEKVLTSLHCHMLVDEKCRDDMYPRLGNLVMLDLGLHQMNGPDIILPVFGYVSYDRKDRFDPTIRYHRDLLKRCPRPVYKVSFYIQVRERKNSSIVVDKPIRIMNVKYIRGDLRVFQAMKNLSQLPLQYNIISPSAADADFTLPDVSHKKLALREVLNPSQEKMVLQTAEVCLQDKPKICLIQGPPGTGKSHVITSLVMQLLYRDRMYSKANREKGLIPRILLCAPSNNAVDVLARRLLSRRQSLEQQHRFKMVRVGQPNFMHPDILGISLQELAKQDIRNQNHDLNDPQSIQTDISNWQAKLKMVENTIQEIIHSNKIVPNELILKKADCQRRLRVYEDRLKNARSNISPAQSKRDFVIHKESSMKILRGADIVATTLSSCLIKVMETVFQPSADKYQFSACIVDEATQCLEAETLIPLMLGVKTLVLVGDSRQLPATILSKVSREKGLGTSLFARLQKCVPGAVQLLDVQYRMHPEIISWPNAYFYRNRLKTPDNFIKERHSKLTPYAILSLPYQQDTRNGEVNEQEGKLVLRLAELIVEKKAVESNQFRVGIVTPYQNQRRLLLQLLERTEQKFSCLVEVNTIDSFQGKEKDIIIMSCVRTNGVGFLSDQQRLNVALTRAKFALFICGNFESLERDEMWSNLLSNARQRRCLLTLSASVTKDQLWSLISKKH